MKNKSLILLLSVFFLGTAHQADGSTYLGKISGMWTNLKSRFFNLVTPDKPEIDLKTTRDPKVVTEYFFGEKGAKEKTQSATHLRTTPLEGDSFFQLQPEQRRDEIAKMHEWEIQQEKKGNYTLWTGGTRERVFCGEIFNKLREMKGGIKRDRIPLILEESPSFPFFEERRLSKAMSRQDLFLWHQDVRRQLFRPLLKRIFTKHKNMTPRLFTNPFIFGFTNRDDESAIYYFLQGRNASGGFDYTAELFKKFNFLFYYRKYGKDFKKLRDLFNASGKPGIMFGISLTKEQIERYVKFSYPSVGFTRSVTIDDGKGGRELTSNVKRVLDLCKNDPGKIIGGCNSLLCTLILTHGKGHALDPKNGPKVKNFMDIDPKKYKLYEQKRDELFEKIARDEQKRILFHESLKEDWDI